MRIWLPAFLGYSALAVVLTWPLAAHLASVAPGDLGDPILNTWILWWNSRQVPLTEAWWNAPAFFPATGVMAYSEHLLGLAPISSPLIWLTGEPGLAYNVTFLLTFPLSATAALLLVRDLTGRSDVAVLAGLLYGFSPYRIAHLSHLQVLATFWMPLALLGLHRFVRSGGTRWLGLFAGAWLMQALSNGYLLAYFSVFLALWLLCLARPWRRMVAATSAWALAVAAASPVLLSYRNTHATYGLARDPAIIHLYSADVTSWLSASPLLSLWSWLPAPRSGEGALFTGLTAVFLAVAGCLVSWARRRRPVADRSARQGFLAFYTALAVAMYAFALGPAPRFGGEALLNWGPYEWLLHLPGVASLRVPARFGMLVMLSLAIAGALGFAAATARWTRWRQTVAGIVVGTVVVAESWVGAFPLWDRPQPWTIRADEIRGALLVLPILNELNDVASMSRAMVHGRPIVNGYSGHEPPWYRTLKEGLNNQDPAVLEALARAGVTEVAVVLRNDKDSAWRLFVSERGRLLRTADDSTFALFDLDDPPRLPAGGQTVKVLSVVATVNPELAGAAFDGNIESRWHSAGPQAGQEALTVELEALQPLATLELALGRHQLEFPRALIIEVSADRTSWTEVWRGGGAAAALWATMQAPVSPRLVFDLGGHAARFVRLTQTDRHPSIAWTVAELAVRATDAAR